MIKAFFKRKKSLSTKRQEDTAKAEELDPKKLKHI